jgi:MFS family permease
VIQGLGFGLFFPTTVRLVSEWGPPEWTSTSQGIMNAGLWGLAPLVAAPVGGVVYDAFGPVAVFLACVGVTLVATLLVAVAQAAGVFGKKVERSAATEGATITQIPE